MVRLYLILIDDFLYLITELVDLFVVADQDQSAANQPSSLADGHTHLIVNMSPLIVWIIRF